MRRLMSRTVSLLAIACLLGLTSAVSAQATKPGFGPSGATPAKPAPDPAPVAPVPGAKPPNFQGKEPPKPAKPAGPATVKFQDQVRPGFIIQPIVNRLEARRGKVLLVEWAITCEGAPASIEIRPVALSQDENGSIFADDKLPPPADLTILTPLKVEMQPTEKFIVKGRLRVPDTDSNYHTFGLLVRDAGQLKIKTDANQPDGGARVGVNFITQYLIRADLTVPGVPEGLAAKLKIESMELVEQDGVPFTRAWIVNPTEGPIQFGVRSQIRATQESANGNDFLLGMRARAALEPPDKYVGRILPGARIRMESRVPFPVFPGEYYIETSVMDDNRVAVKSGQPVKIRDGEFPAQGLESVQAAPGLIVSPSQIELSVQRGGSRSSVLVLKNDSPLAQEIKLAGMTPDGAPAEWIAVRPDSVSLPAGATRKVAVTLVVSGDMNIHRYARLKITSQAAGATPHDSTPISVALLGRGTGAAVLEASSLAWDTTGAVPSFMVKVTNSGIRHFPAEAMLTLADESDRPIDIKGGFGQWILPGTTETIRFKPPRSLPNGHYKAIVRIQTADPAQPIEQKLELDYTGGE